MLNAMAILTGRVAPVKPIRRRVKPGRYVPYAHRRDIIIEAMKAGGVELHQLAELLGICEAQVQHILYRMRDEGLVERVSVFRLKNPAQCK